MTEVERSIAKNVKRIPRHRLLTMLSLFILILWHFVRGCLFLCGILSVHQADKVCTNKYLNTTIPIGLQYKNNTN